MFKNPLFNAWLNAAATAISAQIGTTSWHDMPARQSQFIRKAVAEANEPVQLDFIEAFKAAAD